MINGNYASIYAGRWFTDEEAQKIQTDIVKNAGTGEMGYWVDRQGNHVDLSGSGETKETKEYKEIPIWKRKLKKWER
jgi:hypothetical protein